MKTILKKSLRRKPGGIFLLANINYLFIKNKSRVHTHAFVYLC